MNAPRATQELLPDLWRSRLKTLAMALLGGGHDHEEIANLAEHIGHDYKGRFLIELLQNANDQHVPQEGEPPELGLGEAGSVAIVATDELVAVFNQGRGFDAAGLDAVTSLAFSSKDAEVHVGNKGVGFKSVYEVTDRPILVSRRSGTGGLSSERSPPWSVCLSLQPFEECAALCGEVERAFEHMRAAYGELVPSLVERFGSDEAAQGALRGAAERSAPFKFPIPLDSSEVEQHFEALGVDAEFLERYETAVLLPLRPEALPVVREALNEFLQEGDEPAGALVLTTPGVSRIAVRPPGSEEWTLHARWGLTHSPGPAPGVSLLEVQTGTWTAGSPEVAVPEGDVTSTQWIGGRTIFGSPNRGELHTQEQERLREVMAASHMPGKGWEKVRTAPVLVALPASQLLPGSGVGEVLEGRISIALPTRHRTGTHWTVDARFQGTLSRKDLDLTTAYNALLLTEAVCLAGHVLRGLQAADDLDRRRLATVALEPLRPDAEFACGMWSQDGPALRPSVLAADETSWLTPEAVRLPHREDAAHEGLRVFELLVELLAPAELLAAFPGLPEGGLLRRHASSLTKIASAGRAPGHAVPRTIPPDALFGTPGASLVEALASRKRDAGPGFWRRFLRWLIQRSSHRRQKVLPLAFLPTGRDALSSPASRVFARRSGDEADDETDPLESLPAALLDTLPFLDEEAVPVRKAGKRTLSDFGRQLIEESPFVRSPRLSELTKDVVGPALQQAAESGRTEEAVALLALLLLWTGVKRPLKADDAQAVEALRVPVEGPDGTVTWRHPTEVYFGDGWLQDPSRESLLRVAYGGSGRRLVARHLFAGLGEASPAAMEVLGVAAHPRILKGKAGQAPLRGAANGLIMRSPNQAFPEGLPKAIQGLWDRWIDSLAHRKLSAATTSNQGYGPKESCWVDGLEMEGPARRAVFDLMVLAPQRYVEHARTTIQRTSTSAYQNTNHRVYALWVWALIAERWALIPTLSGERTPVRGTWLLESEQQRRPLASLLNVCDVPLSAWDLLETLGVPRLGPEAPGRRLVAGLHELSTRLPLEPAEARPGATLARTLFELLAGKVSLDGATWKGLTEEPVPLVRGDGRLLESHCLTEIDEPVYVDDDPVRARHIPGFSGALRLPGRGEVLKRGGFIERLSRRLPHDRLRRCSLASVEHGFEGRSEGPLLSWLEAASDERTLVAIAATLVEGGGQFANPHKPGGAFKSNWALLGSVDLRLGRFPPSGGGLQSVNRVFYDSQEHALLVDDGQPVESADVIGVLWHVVGKGFQHIFPNLAQAVRADALDPFLGLLGYAAPELEDLASAIGRGGLGALRHHMPAVFVKWREQHPEGTLEEFRGAVRGGGLGLEAALRALGLGALESELRTAGLGSPGEVAANWFGPEGLPMWQAARATLGEEPWIFQQTLAAVTRLRGEVAARVMSDVAHASPDAAKAVGDVVSTVVASKEFEVLSRGLAEDAEILDALVEAFARALEGAALGRFAKRLVRKRGDLAELGTQREVSEYLDEPVVRRATEATNALQALLRVAGAVGTHLGVPLSPEAIRAHEAIALYTGGPWANRFALLAVLKAVLATSAPEVEKLLTKGKAFRAPPESWRTLWTSIPGLPPPATATQRPSALVSAGGKPRTREEHEKALTAGSVGEIGRTLRAAAPNFDVLGSLMGDRGVVPARVRGTQGDSGGGGGGGAPTGAGRGGGVGGSGGVTRPWGRNPPREDATTGMLGEAFVYEWLKKNLPQEARLRWVSKASEKYGVDGLRDDGLGYDLEFKDVDGTFGAPGLRCLVEVKATKGASSQKFPMSWAEWRCARDASADSSLNYMIIRVTSALSDKPQIGDVIVDPARLERDGHIDLQSKDLWVRVARVVGEE